MVLVDRANYGRLKPVMQAIDDHPALELQVLAAGTMVLERFDQPVELVRARRLLASTAKSTWSWRARPRATMAKSVGFGVVEFANEFQRLKPDLVLLIGDRYEALAAAIAAAYMNISVVHLQGGEVSGLDRREHAARDHASSPTTTSPATHRSAEYLVRMGERARDDAGRRAARAATSRGSLDRDLTPSVVNRRGRGVEIDVDKPFLLVVFHPTTTEYGGERGADGGPAARPRRAADADDPAVAEHRRRLRPHQQGDSRSSATSTGADWLRMLTNLSARRLPAGAGANRLRGRELEQLRSRRRLLRHAGGAGGQPPGGPRARTSTYSTCRRSPRASSATIRRQLANGRYPPSTLYGDGYVAEAVVRALTRIEPYVQKRLSFVAEPSVQGLDLPGAPPGIRRSPLL